MEEIYKKYSKLVYNYLYRLTNNVEVSEELMQETFYSAIKGINKLKEKNKIKVWLCQIAKNKWKDYLKKSNKIKSTFLEENIGEFAFIDNISDQLIDKEEIVQLYKKIHNLDENIREIFYLRIQGNLTFKEIAEIIGKSEEWVRVSFYRAKIKIKEELLKNEK